jgi:hypothetical protein
MAGAATMPNKQDYDGDYRPASYWDVDGLLKSPFANIKGQLRRRAVEDSLENPEAEPLSEDFYEESLTESSRQATGAVHPWMMGGEYLPDAEQGEVEIARVVLNSTTLDVISVRARPIPGGEIGYRIVDEYEDMREGEPITHEPTKSKRPLTTGELIDLIDSAEYPPSWNFGSGPGLTLYFLDGHYQNGAGEEEIADFVTVESTFYPGLASYYREEARAWLLEKLRAYDLEDLLGSRDCSEARARVIAEKHIGDDYEVLDVSDCLPENCPLAYVELDPTQQYWFVTCVEAFPVMLGSSRLIVVSQCDSEIVHDGSACDEG